ncbi:magnesium transporter NIPA-domain-containing protein [Lentinula edodes]|uniref:Magnesium transporter NIPA-domain-containing protein n=1 Tax=Lentinula lateritia TaxID=40482 RepID=A0A9W8ZSA8_9AGAR|nr:magnesium transporter NIPA-domain-containing protein [Lentinula edodes]KAH7868192.1 magnesium transporter NIPA-domain-containing protein [Lentinula edodes]KAJ4465626.1 magnesium transporter NIPA-domain-containing protein [Lentinula edodes]
MSSSAEDKWIGLTLAISSSVAIGMSSIITKKGLNAAAIEGASASDNHAYLKNSIWWLGISTQILGEIANFTAYTFAPPILVTPLGALSVLVGAIAASLMLGEFLGHLGRVGCTLSLIGSLMIVINAPEDKQVDTVDQILEYAAQPAFMLYVMAVLIYSVVAITVIVPRYGRTLPWVYISICSLVGSVSVMSIKAFGIAIKLTVGGNNQFFRPSTYVFGVALILSAVVQLNYYNKSLDTFSVNIVNPMYYVGFTSATIVASLILFQGFNTDNAAGAVSLLCGFAVTFLGVHVLDVSRRENDALEDSLVQPLRSSVPGESGFFIPRQSLGDRTSLDRWDGQNAAATRSSLSHHRRTSSTNLFDLDSRQAASNRNDGRVPLHGFREEDEWEMDGGERIRRLPSGQRPRTAQTLPRHPDLLT